MHYREGDGTLIARAFVEQLKNETLPEGYTIKPSEEYPHLLYIYKNGKVCRMQNALPVRFLVANRTKAIAHARQHSELGLEANQQVPNSGY